MVHVPDATPRPDRRDLICDTALDLAAAGGNRAVTHSGIDRALDLPKGSVSYYYRTRRALLTATVTHLTTRSAVAFADTSTLADPAATIGVYLHDLLTLRARDVRARYALAPDAARDEQLAVALGGCLFSGPRATALFTAAGSATAADDAADLLVFCEGVAATHLFTGVAPSAASITASVRRRFGSLSQ